MGSELAASALRDAGSDAGTLWRRALRCLQCQIMPSAVAALG